MITNVSRVFMKERLQDSSYQLHFPTYVPCYRCKEKANPIMIINDDEGLIAQNSPNREPSGRPIWPHDSASFVLYMCSECGEVTTLWNQA